MAGRNLFKLLDLNPGSEEDIQRLDVNSIIKELQQNPSSAAKRYPFSYLFFEKCFPLQTAILLRAPFEVISLLLSIFPDAAKECCFEFESYCGRLPIHTVCEFGASLDTISCVLESWPDAITVKITKREHPFLLHV
mmetsp:Transcript_17478/g.24956  ORF Transcript_17478/g.24956 Transcript_17478/m.24956 type:complete len:136 (-) Transcript_17478:184-591(-)